MKSIKNNLITVGSWIYDYGYFWAMNNRNIQKPQGIYYVDELPNDIRSGWFLYYTQPELL